MMGGQAGDQSQLFYLFNLEERIPVGHLLRRINPVVTRVLADLRERLAPFYSEIGRPSIDPELMIRMLIDVRLLLWNPFRSGDCARRSAEMHLAYRWFLQARSLMTRFRITRRSRSTAMGGSATAEHLAPCVRRQWYGLVLNAGLVKGEGLAVDASVIEADASRYHGKPPDEIDWSLPERQTRAAVEFLAGLDDEDPDANRKLPKVISPTDPCSAWTAKANKRVQFGYGLSQLSDGYRELPVIVDVEATPLPEPMTRSCCDEDYDQADQRATGLAPRTSSRRYGLRHWQVPQVADRSRHQATYSRLGYEPAR